MLRRLINYAVLFGACAPQFILCSVFTDETASVKEAAYKLVHDLDKAGMLNEYSLPPLSAFTNCASKKEAFEQILTLIESAEEIVQEHLNNNNLPAVQELQKQLLTLYAFIIHRMGKQLYKELPQPTADMPFEKQQSLSNAIAQLKSSIALFLRPENAPFMYPLVRCLIARANMIHSDAVPRSKIQRLLNDFLRDTEMLFSEEHFVAQNRLAPSITKQDIHYVRDCLAQCFKQHQQPLISNENLWAIAKGAAVIIAAIAIYQGVSTAYSRDIKPTLTNLNTTVTTTNDAVKESTTTIKTFDATLKEFNVTAKTINEVVAVLDGTEPQNETNTPSTSDPSSSPSHNKTRQKTSSNIANHLTKIIKELNKTLKNLSKTLHNVSERLANPFYGGNFVQTDMGSSSSSTSQSFVWVPNNPSSSYCFNNQDSSIGIDSNSSPNNQEQFIEQKTTNNTSNESTENDDSIISNTTAQDASSNNNKITLDAEVTSTSNLPSLNTTIENNLQDIGTNNVSPLYNQLEQKTLQEVDSTTTTTTTRALDINTSPNGRNENNLLSTGLDILGNGLSKVTNILWGSPSQTTPDNNHEASNE